MANKNPVMSKRFGGLLPVVVDLETGGLHPETDALLEVAAVAVQFDEAGTLAPGDHFSTHVEPFAGARIDPKSLEINGIDPDHPFRFALPESEMLAHLFAFVRAQLKTSGCRRAVMVAHNAHFDLAFLQAAIARCNEKSPFHAFTVLDTATLGALACQHTVLAKAVQAAGIPFNAHEAHSALYDADITAQLFCHIVNRWSTSEAT
jgi:ribonuclease T